MILTAEIKLIVSKYFRSIRIKSIINKCMINLKRFRFIEMILFKISNKSLFDYTKPRFYFVLILFSSKSSENTREFRLKKDEILPFC